MLSLKPFTPWEAEKPPSLLMSAVWADLAIQFQLQALFVIVYDPEKTDMSIASSYGVPVEPFNGSEKQWLLDAVEDCFSKHPKPHVHNISHLGLANVIKRFSQKLHGTNRVWFIPTLAYGISYIFLGFPLPDSKEKAIPKEFIDPLDRALSIQSSSLSAAAASERLRVTELFVKEMGHDVVSSVQAILGKAQTIADGRVTGQAAKNKAREIETEIMNTHRVAEFLGTAVEPDYQIRNADDFDFDTCVRSAMIHYTSEINEKRLKLRYQPPKHSIRMWGDSSAIEQAIGQLLLNAVKYSFGQTEIEMVVSEESETATLTVSNRGIRLPGGKELQNIWDFGYRGRTAKDHHVNGSGIGLYTVKKIAVAHAGTVFATTAGDNTVFRLSLPKRDQARFRLSRLL